MHAAATTGAVAVVAVLLLAGMLLLASQNMRSMAGRPASLSLRTAGGANVVSHSPRDAVAQWLVQYIYRDDHCSGEVEHTQSIALGACMFGVDPRATYLNSTDGVSVTTMDVGFSFPDCSGPPTRAWKHVRQLDKCVHGSQYKLVNAANSAPWAGSVKGIVVLDSVHGDCSTPSEVFQAISFGFCVSAADTHSGAASVRYDSCTADEIVYTSFSDRQCQHKVETKTFPTSLCMDCPGGKHCYPQGAPYHTHESFVCNA